jgi:predicted acyltransferase
VPFGINALFIYVTTSLIPIKAGTDIFTQPIAAHLGSAGLLFEALAALALEWLILFWMMKRKVFVKV